MVIGEQKLMVSPVTTHLDLKSVSKKLNKKTYCKQNKTLNNWYVKFFKKNQKLQFLDLILIMLNIGITLKKNLLLFQQ